MENIKIKYLVVVDMQNDFVTGVLGSKEAQAIVPNVMKKLESKDYQAVYFTRDCHSKTGYKDTVEGKYLPIPHCLYETEGYEFIDPINKFMDDNKALYATYTKSAFCSKDLINDLWSRICDDLDDYDKDEASIEVEFIGLCTDICVISNAIGFKNMMSDEYYATNLSIKCDSSCCAGSTPEKHLAALEVMKSCHIEVY